MADDPITMLLFLAMLSVAAFVIALVDRWQASHVRRRPSRRNRRFVAEVRAARDTGSPAAAASPHRAAAGRLTSPCTVLPPTAVHGGHQARSM